MRQTRVSSFIFFLLSFLVSSSVFAAAFQFYELGTPIIGTAAVGQAVVANDASTSYFNPAGMVELQTSQYLLGSEVVVPYNYFSQSSRTTIKGDNGGSAGTLTPGVNLFYVYSLSPKLKLGISLTSPYGGLLTYNDGWAGRFFVQNIALFTLNLNPAIAYQVNDWLAVGGGASLEYASLQETIALPILPLVDGQINIKVNSFAPGVNVGVMLTPTKTTKVGIAYRSRINHHLSGDITFLRLPVVPNATTNLVMPQNVIASVSQKVANQFVLLGELGWSAWSSMKNTVVHVDGFSGTTPRDWRDTYRLGIAGQYLATPSLTLQTGLSYDSSPTTSSRRLPDLPMDRQVRAAAGLIYSFMPAVQMGFSYEYINMGNANINNHSSNGVLVGSYARNYVNVFQASINVAC